MTADDFTTPVENEIAAAKQQFAGRVVSDIIDGDGNQYVDLVMGGGGVLGIALVGYTYALESLGVRFLRVGGTSAGSINALALAAFGPPAEPKSRRLVEELANMSMWSFVDGPSSSRALIKDFLGQRSTFWKAVDGTRAYPHVSATLGLNPGTAFKDWLVKVLKDAGIVTTGQLAARLRQTPASLQVRGKGPMSPDEADARLGMVAADITTETKVELPRMADLYWADPDAVNPAEYVRASMSIPFFFEPVRVGNVPQTEAARAKWKELNRPLPPAECAFVDGGILSNFPIAMFHGKPAETPTAPTFGVKLGADPEPVGHFDGLVPLTMAVFNTARHSLDNEFIGRHPDYSQLVCTVKTGNQSWLNFDLTPEEKIDLFRRGVEAGIDFATRFDWAGYKKTREALREAHRKAHP